MFDNVGAKIKDVTRVFCALGMTICIIGGIYLIIQYSNSSYGYRLDSEIWTGIGLLVLGPLFSWIGSLAMFGFGELIDTTQKNNKLLNNICSTLNNDVDMDVDNQDTIDDANENSVIENNQCDSKQNDDNELGDERSLNDSKSTDSVKPREVIVCPKCGAVNNVGEFCIKCGQRFSKE